MDMFLMQYVMYNFSMQISRWESAASLLKSKEKEYEWFCLFAIPNFLANVVRVHFRHPYVHGPYTYGRMAYSKDF